jgi:hypothetical protein
MQVYSTDGCGREIRAGSGTAALVRCASFIVLTFLLAGCGTSLQLASGWNSSEVKIDGVNSEWRDAMTYARTSDASVGIKNDGDRLYVCFTTSNRQTQLQMLAFGLTTWFSPEGKKERTFGIHFPVGGQLQALRLLSRDRASEELQQLIRVSQGDLEVVGPTDANRRRITDQEAAGIKTRLGFSEESLVYELEVPLRKTADHPFAIGATESQMISVGFETGEISTTLGGQQSGPSAVSTPSRGGRGGRSPGGTSSSAGGMGSERLEPLRLWATFQLASAAAPVTK